MGLPARIAIPVFVVFAIAFLGILAWFLRVGFGTTGSAFGPSVVHEQGDSRIAATAAPIATDPPGTFTVPQTGSGPMPSANGLPGASTGGGNAAGGPPAPVMQQLNALRARLAHDPNDVEARVELAEMEADSRHLDVALTQIDAALKVRPNDPRAVYDRGVIFEAMGRNADAVADYRRYLRLVPPDDSRAARVRAILPKIGG
ncbi:MAG TPA: tetratricopeptide repeat protein [Candidatus Elarobacter sp.]|jgi:tetratricopeptide (TPR) repeat protein|nr:tetratricopeptide repeat protein [Candidatus Elarobacter sp.]